MKKLIFIISLFLLPVASFAAMPAFPMAFWGTITLNGNPAPVNTVVRAYYGDILAGQVVVAEDEGIYGYTESTKQKLVVKEGIGELSFTFETPSINGGVETSGCTSVSYAGFTSELTVPKNLVFNTTGCGSGEDDPTEPVATTPPSTGGSPGGGGGGVFQPSTVDKKGDANSDNKVDIFDFNTLMINWGKTGSNLNDFNSDNKVDIFDFNLLMVNWGK